MSIQIPVNKTALFKKAPKSLINGSQANTNSIDGNSTPFVLIVVPCYNEAERLNIPEFLIALDENPQLNFLFVDDGSTDKTLDILGELQDFNPERVFLYVQEKNAGKAEAVRQGLLFATASGADLVGYWDADLATPLADIRDFSKILFRYNDVDIVYGSRIQLLGHRIKRTIARRTVSRICSSLARLAVRLPIRDTQCGAKLLRNNTLLRNNLYQEFSAGWLFDVELFARISASVTNRNKAFYEYPLAEWNEIEGSKVTSSTIVKSGFKMLSLIFSIQFKNTKNNVPSAIEKPQEKEMVI